MIRDQSNPKIIPNYTSRSSLKDLEARFSKERLRQRITDLANRSTKLLESIAMSEFKVVDIAYPMSQLLWIMDRRFEQNLQNILMLE